MAQDITITLDDGSQVCGRLHGPKGAPVVVVLGGISAGRAVATDGSGAPGWWPALVGHGRAVDLDHVAVLGMDYGPGDGNDCSGDPITTADQAARLKALLDHLGTGQAAAVIGASYGGMVALAFARDFPDRVQQICLISAAHQPAAMGAAWRGIQRRMVRFAIACGRPEEGMKLARELAMTSYRTAQEFEQRFTGAVSASAPLRLDICDYLHACGAKFARTMPAQRFLALSESIDLHRIAPETVHTPALLIASRHDLLAPPAQMQALRRRLGGPARLVIIESPYGHDAFLKETGQIGALLRQFVKEKHHATA